MVELQRRKGTMRFDRSATTTSNGIGVVLSCEDGGTMPFSFKLEFPCSNNAAEYEAYLIGLTIALGIDWKSAIKKEIRKLEHGGNIKELKD